MKVLKFELSGETGFFKKPEVNSYYYFTYGHIHKVALLGMFGAILGYKGYSGKHVFDKQKMDLSPGFPEFYKKLRDLKIAVVPHSENGMFPKKIQAFNNSVGYASKEQGGNLIVKEQWLEEPKWDIYLQLCNNESQKIAEKLERGTCVYTPYLGKNDHIADISEIAVEDAVRSKAEDIKIHSLALKSSIIYEPDYNEYDMGEPVYKYEEVLPVGLDEKTNLYLYETFILTNIPVKQSEISIYRMEDKNIVFH